MNKILRKIAKKLLLILPFSKVDWAVRKILEFYERIYYINMFDKKQETCPMNFKHYLPNTEERIERLRKVIKKRPVAIILPGFSLRELQERIAELEDYDICYAGVNTFKIIEDDILQKIGRDFSIVMCSANPASEMNSIVDFLEKQKDNTIIFGTESFQVRKKELPRDFDLNKFIEKYDKKLLFFTGVFTPFILTMGGELFPQIPSREYPLHFRAQNSLSTLLLLILIGGASKVVIFGGDGGKINGQELYFSQSALEKNFIGKSLSKSSVVDKESLIRSYMIDTKVFNATMPLILKRVYKIYNLKPVDIINCSEKSHYTPFRKVSYDEAFVLLKH